MRRLTRLCVSLVAMTGFAGAQAEPRSLRLADVLPNEVIFYGEIPDGGKLAAAFERHPFVRMIRSDAFSGVRDTIAGRMKEPLSEMPVDQVELVRDMLDGHLEFALLSPGELVARFVVRVGMGPSAADTFDLVSTMATMAENVEIVEEDDRKLVQIDVAEHGFGTIDMLAARDSIVIGNDRALLLAFAAGEPLADGFASTLSVRSAREQATQRGAHAHYWMDAKRYFDVIASIERLGLGSAYESFGIDGVMHGSVRYGERGVSEQGAITGYSAGGLVGRLYGAMKPGISFDRLAPGATGFWFGARLDLKAGFGVLFNVARNSMREVNPGMADAFDTWNDRERNPMGISVRDDLIDALGEEASIEVIPPEYGIAPQVVLRAAVADASKLNATLEKLRTGLAEMGRRAPFQLRRKTVKDTTMYVFSGLGVSIRPAVTVHEGQFVACLFANRLRSALEVPKAPLRSRPALLAALKRMGVTDATRLGSLLYIDWYALASYGRNMLEPILPQFEATRSLKVEEWPTMEELQPFLPPTVQTGWLDGDRVVFRTDGPMGQVAGGVSLIAALRLFIDYAIETADRK